jgi:hypothetical protein
MLPPTSYKAYRSYGHPPWTAFVLSTSIWWWIAGFPIGINLAIFLVWYLVS